MEGLLARGNPPVYGLKGSRTVSRPGLEVWRFYGDPTPLARDNIFSESPIPSLNILGSTSHLRKYNNTPIVSEMSLHPINMFHN